MPDPDVFVGRRRRDDGVSDPRGISLDPLPPFAPPSVNEMPRSSGSAEAIALPIRLEPTAIRPDGPSLISDRSEYLTSDRDVLIPRGAFLAWSLFVVLALGLAFVAGLLTGRFVWT